MSYLFILLVLSLFSNLVIEATTLWQLPPGTGVGEPRTVKPKPANPSTEKKEEL